MTETVLDAAYAAMAASPEDDRLRLRYYERLADGEFFLLLETEAEDEDVTPQIFPVDGTEFVLIFDREERLADFVGGTAPYLALSGRSVAEMLAGENLGLLVNPGVEASQNLIDPASVAWLHQTLGTGPEETEDRPEELTPPAGLPEDLLTALDTKLAMAGGLAAMAYLSAVKYDSGRRGHLLAFIDAMPGSDHALASLVSEALVFSGIEAGELDVVFLKASDPVCAQLARVGLRFDLPAPEVPTGPAAPGMDPESPPRLR